MIVGKVEDNPGLGVKCAGGIVDRDRRADIANCARHKDHLFAVCHGCDRMIEMPDATMTAKRRAWSRQL